MGKLVRSFGKNGRNGLPINLIETLLLISSKQNGVKFYFDEKFNFSLLNNCLVDLVFDASGGRIPNTKQKTLVEPEIKVETPNHKFICNHVGMKNLPKKNMNSKGNFSLTLKENGYYYYPYLNETQLSFPMMKLTQVPTSLHSVLMKFVQTMDNNRFYIWKGKLADEINELLVIINLTTAEYNYLKPMIDDRQKLSSNIVEKAFESKKLGTDLVDFLKLCAANHDEQIYINPPYVSQPAVNLKPLDQKINKIEVYPVGDSLFTGNPKVGNGLMNHLSRIAKLVRTIENAI